MAHISKKTLEDFVACKLRGAEAEAVMQHLTENEEALAYVDRLWAQQLALATAVTPSLDIQAANRIERRLIQRIHQSNLAGTLFRFGLVGFGKVAQAILMPVTQKVLNLETEEN